MKTIYIVMIKSQTVLSKIIALTTSDPYTHVSICFNKDIKKLYSFGRKNKNKMYPAGLVIENINNSFIGNDIPYAIYSIQVSVEVFKEVKLRVELMIKNIDSYRFNTLGLFLCKFGISLKRKKHYFCSQFVSEILFRSNVILPPKPSSLMKPSDFLKLPELTYVHKGILNSVS